MKPTAVRAALVAVLAGVCVVCPGAIAFALWSTSATGTLTVSVASAPSPSPTVTPPTGLKCSENSDQTVVTIRWTAASPSPANYEVFDETKLYLPSPVDTTFLFTPSMLTNGAHDISVRAVYSDGSKSTSASTIKVKRNNGGSNSAGQVTC